MPGHRQDAPACWQGDAGRVFVEPPKGGGLLGSVRLGRRAARNRAQEARAWSKRGSGASRAERESASGEKRSRASACLATFRELYRSHDGRFIVYEDEDGHLTSVNTSRLA